MVHYSSLFAECGSIVRYKVDCTLARAQLPYISGIYFGVEGIALLATYQIVLYSTTLLHYCHLHGYQQQPFNDNDKQCLDGLTFGPCVSNFT